LRAGRSEAFDFFERLGCPAPSVSLPLLALNSSSPLARVLGALIQILLRGATSGSVKHRFDTQLAGRRVADDQLRSAPVQSSETKSPMLGSTR
jgi:hypothetical protein